MLTAPQDRCWKRKIIRLYGITAMQIRTLGVIRAWELKEELRDLVSNLNLEIMDGDKVIEVKNSGINKGRAAAQATDKREI
jgi:hypothetical protein